VKVPATDPAKQTKRLILCVIRLLEASRRHCPLDTDARTTSVNDYVNKTAAARMPDKPGWSDATERGPKLNRPLKRS